jgi:pimeloyl-ACP methyl ester carboxylesterase
MPSTSQALRFQAPSLALLATEPFRALFDICSSPLGRPPVLEGDGHPVIVYPGLGASSLATSQLRHHLRACNFKVHDWELGVNRGPEGELAQWLEPLLERVRALHALHGRKVSLVGWSLGGIYAREVAKRCPESVRQVITLATPFCSLGDGNHAGTIVRLMGGDTSQLTPQLQARLSERPPVPTTSIYSRNDGVVSWRGCLQEAAPDLENIAVPASHMGMPTHPEVLRVVADRLAQPEDGWRPYRRRRPALRPATAPSRSTR